MKISKRKKKKLTEQPVGVVRIHHASCIYGPPDRIEAYRKLKQSLRQSENNVPEDVYGPPDMLDAIQPDPDKKDEE